jgi:glycerol-3-phosphate cytidylyltransferase-like family protein
VGLTTDDQVLVEKGRSTVLTFDERRTILENSKWVDAVVENHGETKNTMWDALKFDILFSGMEYMHDPDLQSFDRSAKVVYIPRETTVSTTDMIDRLEERVVRQLSIRSLCLNGPVLQFNTSICKLISLTPYEVNTTADVFHMHKYDTLPRNYKGEHSVNTYPMVSGFNGTRELRANLAFADREWSCYKYHTLVYQRNPSRYGSLHTFPYVYESPLEMARHVNKAREDSCTVYQIIQRDGGETMTSYLTNHPSDGDKQRIVNRVQSIIEDIRASGFVHGDIHANNVLINNNGQVSIIDWGWCQSRSFDNTPKEYEDVQQKLRDNYDWQHFTQSLDHVYT